MASSGTGRRRRRAVETTTGVWVIGARGSVATTTYIGAAAVGRGLVPPTGMVTAEGRGPQIPLPAVDSLVFGGHDLVDTPVYKRAEQLVEDRVVPAPLFSAVADSLTLVEANVRPAPVGLRAGATIDRIRADLREFRSTHHLGRVVVVHLASTEPPAALDPAFDSLTALRAGLAADAVRLPDSTCYAFAALEEACPYINFTPSTGACLPALEELARVRDVPHAGRDGKTGETLVRTALAPMFLWRNLQVRSWSGVNLLGGGDGATLADPSRCEAKLLSKGRPLESILGYRPQMPLHIDYVPAMGEWKTAWDHVVFDGFLGIPMRLQFTWEGCDSALAAPLVLDLVRLLAAADAAGASGAFAPLSFFFKDPVGTDSHSLAAQYALLYSLQTGRGAVDG